MHAMVASDRRSTLPSSRLTRFVAVDELVGVVLTGEVPSPLNPPTGCVFHPRCPIAIDDCSRVTPELREVEPGQWASCIRAAGYGAY